MKPSQASLARALARHLQGEPDTCTLTVFVPNGEPRPLRNERLHAAAAWHAQALATAGIVEGDLVVISLDHGPSQVAAFIGALYHGALPALVPAPGRRVEGRERVHRLALDAGARAVVVSADDAAALRDGPPPGAYARVTSEEVAFEGTGEITLSDRGGEDIAYVQFSSGTTGTPKGAMLSHRAALANIDAIRQVFAYSEADVSVIWLPLYHDMGLMTAVLLPITTGARSVLIASQAWLRTPASLLRAVAAFRGTTTWMPNFAFDYCVRAIESDVVSELDLSSWRLVGNGAEPVRGDTLQRFARHLAPAGFEEESLVAGYGLAESVVAVSVGDRGRAPSVEWVSAERLREGAAVLVEPDAPDAVEVASCGAPVAGTTVSVTDGRARELPERHVGEICLRGPSLFSGYWRDPAATAGALREGWLHTGDLGYLAGGEIYLCGRKKDLVIIGGQNVYPEHVDEAATEAARRALPEAARFAVSFGVPDPALGTEALVVVCRVRRALSDEEQERLLAALRQAVTTAAGVAPADVQIVQAGGVVTTTSGKVARAATRRTYLERRRESSSEPAGEALSAEALHALVTEGLGVGPLDVDHDFFEAGADSIRVVEVVLQVEDHLGRRLPLERILQRPTLAHLAAVIAEGEPLPTEGAHEPASREGRGEAGGRGTWVSFRRPVPLRLPYRMALGAAALDVRHRLARGGGGAVAERLREASASVCPQRDPDEVARRGLLRHRVMGWIREGRLRGADPILEVRGAESLEAEAGRGVIVLGSHTTGHPLLYRWSARAGRPMMLLRRPDGVDAPTGSPSELRRLSGQLAEARACLDAGGLVGVLGDGHFVQNGLPLPFHGRTWTFGTGFAALAEWTGAAVIPVTTRLDHRGRVVAEIGAPWEAEREDPTALVRRYAALLEAWWADHLEEVGSFYLGRYLDLPLADPARTSPEP